MYLQSFKQLATDVWVKSWSRLWGTAKIAVGASLFLLDQAQPIMTNQDVRDALAHLDVGPYPALILAVLGCITIMAASHKVDQS